MNKYTKYIKDADFISEQFSSGNKYRKKMVELAESSKKEKNSPKFRNLLC